jgi:hypothetical protein
MLLFHLEPEHVPVECHGVVQIADPKAHPFGAALHAIGAHDAGRLSTDSPRVFCRRTFVFQIRATRRKAEGVTPT